jgi:hypothetical protein
MMSAKKIIGRLLTAFLLVSIGVAIGKEMAARSIAPAPPEHAAPAGGPKVIVYYMHGAPCVTCSFIETTTRTVVQDDFADALAAGTIQFVSLNYLDQENEAIADKYNVGGNIVIVVRLDQRGETAVRLDAVMQLATDAEALKDYLRDGIRLAMDGGGR